jgi:F0F1-type ATP synthase assembly protein I
MQTTLNDVTGEPAKIEKAVAERSRWSQARYSRAGSVLLSVDFVSGCLAGTASGYLTDHYADVAEGANLALFAVAGGLFALLAVIIAAQAILVSLISDDYLVLIERSRGGLRGMTRPYKVVAYVCTAGVVTSAIGGLAWPVVDKPASWVGGVVMGSAVWFAVWAVVGTAQLIEQGTFHLTSRAAVLRAIRTVRQTSVRDTA